MWASAGAGWLVMVLRFAEMDHSFLPCIHIEMKGDCAPLTIEAVQRACSMWMVLRFCDRRRAAAGPSVCQPACYFCNVK